MSDTYILDEKTGAVHGPVCDDDYSSDKFRSRFNDDWRDLHLQEGAAPTFKDIVVAYGWDFASGGAGPEDLHDSADGLAAVLLNYGIDLSIPLRVTPFPEDKA